jgi:diguanylate cyclase (GGDEF)-like protein
MARRDGQPLAVALIDLDHFKAVNDEHGHDAGDQVLAAFATLLQHDTRDSDVACRYGGEEFCLLMPNTPAQAALRKVEDLLQRWCRQAVLHRGCDCPAWASRPACVTHWPTCPRRPAC